MFVLRISFFTFTQYLSFKYNPSCYLALASGWKRVSAKVAWR